MDSMDMRPPAVPVKRKAPPPNDGARPPKRLELGEDLPEAVSKEDLDHILDKADEVHVETLNEASLKRMSLQLERKVKVNQDLRIKHADEPEKYLKSEVDLDEEVKKFVHVATHPHLYAELLKLGTIPVMVGLLNHVNTDIAVGVFEVLSELTDADVISETEEPEVFVRALFEAQLCQMTVDVLLRIDESASDDDAKAVSNCMGMIENLADLLPNETCAEFAQIPRLLPWLIKRVRAPGAVDYNRVYASEILGMLLMNSESSRTAMVKLEGVDKLLRGIAVYRKKDPADSEEAEYAQNMFDSLCSLCLMKEHQLAFGKVQGLELMIRMMKEKIFASHAALKMTDHALRHCPENCQLFVDKLGLKVVFSMFMKRGHKTKSNAEGRESEEHVCSIIQSLCRYCTGTPVARVLNKFMEGQFEKLERLLEMHEEYNRSVKEADIARENGTLQQMDRELEVDDEERLFLDRCDAGLFTLQQVDLVLVRLVSMGNRQASEEIGKLMDIKGVKLEEIQHVVEEYCTNLGEPAKDERKEVRSYLKAMLVRYGGDVSKLEDEPAADAGNVTDEDDGAATPDEADPDQVTDDEGGGKDKGTDSPKKKEKEDRKSEKRERSEGRSDKKKEKDKEKDKDKRSSGGDKKDKDKKRHRD